MEVLTRGRDLGPNLFCIFVLNYLSILLNLYLYFYHTETRIPTFFCIFVFRYFYSLQRGRLSSQPFFLYLFQFVLQLGTKLQLLAGMNTFRIENGDQS